MQARLQYKLWLALAHTEYEICLKVLFEKVDEIERAPAEDKQSR